MKYKYSEHSILFVKIGQKFQKKSINMTINENFKEIWLEIPFECNE